jgi:hypothetical protein
MKLLAVYPLDSRAHQTPILFSHAKGEYVLVECGDPTAPDNVFPQSGGKANRHKVSSTVELTDDEIQAYLEAAKTVLAGGTTAQPKPTHARYRSRAGRGWVYPVFAD